MGYYIVVVEIYFYPRTPSGVRRHAATVDVIKQEISIHALQAECDSDVKDTQNTNLISIHALQAECDPLSRHRYWFSEYFYPRTPSGVRLNTFNALNIYLHFYPRTPSGVRQEWKVISGGS